MRLPKFLIIIFTMTIVSLCYVWQQTEIFRLGYEGQHNQSIFQNLLDENSSLRYSLTKSTSLVKIGDKIADNKDFQMPDNYYLVRVEVDKSNPQYAKSNYAKKTNLVSKILGAKSEAVAKPINPTNPLSVNSSKTKKKK